MSKRAEAREQQLRDLIKSLEKTRELTRMSLKLQDAEIERARRELEQVMLGRVKFA